MTWVGWRLQRTEALITLAILALLAALLVPTGITMANAYHHDGLGACLSIKPPGPVCSQRIGGFQLRFESLIHLADWFTLIPGLIGVLLAAPFILDLEHRTYRLAWTQSITRGRWLAGKLGVPIACALLASGALILLLTWWRIPDAHLNGRLDTGIYDSEGTVVVGYMLFAFGLAVALGALWRRSAASVTVAFIGYFAMRIFVDTWLRDRLVTPLTATYRGDNQPRFLYNAHVLSDNASIGSHPITGGGGGGAVLGGHSQFAAPGVNSNTVFHVVYQPANHFWSLQLVETGLFTGLAVVLVAFAVWWTRERMA